VTPQPFEVLIFMVSLILPIVFFYLLVLTYSIASMLLSVSGWILKQWQGKRNIEGKAMGEMADKRTDDLKEVMFNILVFIIFFFVSPFVVFYMVGVIN